MYLISQERKAVYVAGMCVQDYSHFYGQGGSPSATRRCPLWSDNAKVHAQAALWNRNRNRNFLISGTGTVTC
jgi:hypothetical protein